MEHTLQRDFSISDYLVFIPYLFMLASLIRLQPEPAEPHTLLTLVYILGQRKRT